MTRCTAAALLLSVGLRLAAASEVCESVADDATCATGEQPPASLLQRVYHRDAGAAAPHEDEADVHQQADVHQHGAESQTASLMHTVEQVNKTGKQEPLCTGVLKQGRCWYLSELGESCQSTCARNGRGFSYIVADNYDPVTPDLVGHHPRAKQEPWAVLECWVAGEDRYHTASASAARQMVNNIGDWKYDSCQLACPCGEGLSAITVQESEASGECSWKQPPACAPEFEYKGVVYTGCPTVDHDGQPWCMHHHHHTELEDYHHDVLHEGEWSNCVYSCGGVQSYSQVNGCDWKLAPGCVPEYDYEGTHYVGCTSADHDTPWCSLTDPYDKQWDHCVYECPEKADEVYVQNEVTQTDNLLCSWEPARECSANFEYKGIDYTGCTDIDHPTPWCSHDRRHKGSWSLCTRECIAPVAPRVLPTLPPTMPTMPPRPMGTIAPVESVGGACDRHPEVENDLIGNTVELSEAGYQAVVRTSSAINVKRFVCRVADKLDCEVIDYASLMGFVPYYSGAVTHQTYAHLEHEIEILCHTGGKWVRVKRY